MEERAKNSALMFIISTNFSDFLKMKQFLQLFYPSVAYFFALFLQRLHKITPSSYQNTPLLQIHTIDIESDIIPHTSQSIVPDRWACDRRSIWPYARLLRSIAAHSPDHRPLTRAPTILVLPQRQRL